MVGTLETGDADMDAIIQLSLFHAMVTMSDVYVDCPGREDGAWIEVSESLHAAVGVQGLYCTFLDAFYVL